MSTILSPSAFAQPVDHSEMSGRILRKRRERKAAKQAEKTAQAEAKAKAAESAAKREQALAEIAKVVDEAKARHDAVKQAEAEAELAEIQAEDAAARRKALMTVGGVVGVGLLIFLMVKK